MGTGGLTMRDRQLLTVLLCAFGLGGAFPLAAQDARREFAQKSRRYETSARNHDIENIRRLDDLVRSFAALSAGTDAKLQRKIERFLERVVTRRGPEQVYRVRVAALETLGKIARTKRAARFLLGVAGRRERSLELLDFWAARAIGNTESEALVDHVCRDGIAAKKPSVRRAALWGLTLLTAPRARAAVRDHQEAVRSQLTAKDVLTRYHALRLVGTCALDELLPPLIAAARDSDALVRRAAAFSLGRLAEKPETRPVLAALLEDKAVSVREEAVLAFRHANDVRSCPLLIARLASEPLKVQTTIYATLRALSGKDIDTQPGLWRAWWRTKKAELLAGKGSVSPTRSRARKAYGLSYHGIPVLSDRVVFVLDVSGSMDWGGGRNEPRRIDVAKRELTGVLEKLGPETKFNIVAFSGSNIYFEKRRLLPANREWKRKAIRWVKNLAPGGGTNAFGVLEGVFERYPDADTVYMLSDGSPTLGKVRVQEKILAKVAEMNRRTGLRIHTVSLLKGEAPNASWARLDDKDDAARFMSLLAAQTGGTFVRRDE